MLLRFSDCIVWFFNNCGCRNKNDNNNNNGFYNNIITRKYGNRIKTNQLENNRTTLAS